MKIIAHRGLYSEAIKENTLPAFKAVLNNDRYVGAEFDIHETKDNKFVVIHDSLINRTSNGNGLVSKMTYKELLKYNFGTTNNPAKIPLLEEVLKILKDKVKVIEIKNIISYNSLNNILKKEKYVYVASFYKKHLQSLLDFHPIYKIGLFNNLFNSEKNYQIYGFVGMFYKLATKNIIKFFKRNNKEIMLFGIKNLNKVQNIKNKENFYFIVDEN